MARVAPRTRVEEIAELDFLSPRLKPSRLLRQEFPALKSRLPTLWTNSYFVATVGGAPLEIVKQYVENQRRV